jgi:hypothetical protein
LFKHIKLLETLGFLLMDDVVFPFVNFKREGESMCDDDDEGIIFDRMPGTGIALRLDGQTKIMPD